MILRDQKERPMKKMIYVLGFLILFSSSAWAKDWALDPNHSAIQFGITHIFSTVFGSFSDFEGNIRFDPDNLDKSRVAFIVRVSSINTGNTKRDNHLRSNDFFDAAAFPVMEFVSEKITHKTGNQYTAVGTMTLKKTSRTMEIPFVFHGTAPSPFDKKQVVIGFDTRFALNRLEFGVGNGKFYKMGVVGDMVDVSISIEALGAAEK